MTDDQSGETVSRAAALLSEMPPRQRVEFLAPLIFFFGHAARSGYVEAGVAYPDAIVRAKAFNESIIAADELLSALNGRKT